MSGTRTRHSSRWQVRDSLRGFLLALPSSVWLTTFVVAPILILAVHSLFGVERFRLGRTFSLDNYILVFQSGVFSQLFVKTLLVASATTIVCMILAYAPAYHLAFRAGRTTQFLLSLLLLPYLVGYIPRILALRMILGIDGLFNRILLSLSIIKEPITWMLFSNLATVVGLVYVQLPVMIILLFISLERIAPSMLEASYDLGASRFYTLWRVLMPLSRPGLFAGVLLVFLPSMGAYVEPALMGGADGQLLGNIIAQRFIVFMDLARGSAMSLMTLMAMIALALIASRLVRWSGTRA